MPAIISRIGAGKTTMMDVVTGKSPARHRRSLFDGGDHDLTRPDGTEIAVSALAASSKADVFEIRTVENNIRLALKQLQARSRQPVLAHSSGSRDRMTGILNGHSHVEHARSRRRWSVTELKAMAAEIGVLLSTRSEAHAEWTNRLPA